MRLLACSSAVADRDVILMIKVSIPVTDSGRLAVSPTTPKVGGGSEFYFELLHEQPRRPLLLATHRETKDETSSAHGDSSWKDEQGRPYYYFNFDSFILLF